jgi:hypothetical protein
MSNTLDYNYKQADSKYLFGNYITNLFLKVEIDVVIKHIQENDDKIRTCLKKKYHHSLPLAACFHYKNDVKRINENTQGCNPDHHSTDATGECSPQRYWVYGC